MKRLLTYILCLFCLTASAATAVIPDMKFRRMDARDRIRVALSGLAPRTA